jgi:hypothetical protein
VRCSENIDADLAGRGGRLERVMGIEPTNWVGRQGPGALISVENSDSTPPNFSSFVPFVPENVPENLG